MRDTLPSAQVALVKVTPSLQAADDIGPVSPFLNGAQKVHHIDFSGARDPDNIQIGGIFETHGTCQVRG